MRRALVIAAAILFANPAFAWDLPAQVNAAKLHMVGQGDKFGPSQGEAFFLPATLHTPRLSVVGQGDKYGPTAGEAFSLPAVVKTKGLSVVGHL